MNGRREKGGGGGGTSDRKKKDKRRGIGIAEIKPTLIMRDMQRER